MARSPGQRLLLLHIMDYLFERTDETHTVTWAEINSHLENEHELSVERKTLYQYITLLEEYGLDIHRHKMQGYKVVKRTFTLSELQLLIDCIQSSKFITQAKANTITKKLKEQTSYHNRATLERQNYVINRIRNMDDSIFRDVDKIHAAISAKRKIGFRYFTYDLEKEKFYRKKDGYIVSPYALMWNDDNYYLLAYDSEQEKMRHFRVDKMERIRKVDELLDGQDVFQRMNISERKIQQFSMYGGIEERVVLRFTNDLVGVALDRFGKDIPIEPSGEKHFITRVSVEVSPQFYGWLCGLGDRVKIVAPESVAQKMNEHVAKIAALYKEDV